jgi:hypothetical protein
MRNNKYLFTFFAAALFCACAGPVRKATAPAAPAAPVKQAKKETAAPLSPEDAQKVDGLYYRAVGAYSNNDMGAALKYLDEISVISPAYPPGAELRGKIRSVSGGK